MSYHLDKSYQMDEVQGSVLAAVFYPYTITQLQTPHPLFVLAMQDFG